MHLARRHRNLYLDLSGIPPKSLLEYLPKLESLADKCLWGTDWTRAFAVVNYEQAVEPFLKTDRLSDTERAMLVGGACAKAYGWAPSSG